MVREKGVKKERKKDERRPLQSQWVYSRYQYHNPK